MDLSLLSDADILAIDKHVQKQWSRLRQALFEDEPRADVFDEATVFVTASTVHVQYHRHSFVIGLDAPRPPARQTRKAAFIAQFDACLRKVVERMGVELVRLGAVRSQMTLKRWDFEDPRDAWLPGGTIAFVRDFIRVGRVLRDE